MIGIDGGLVAAKRQISVCDQPADPEAQAKSAQRGEAVQLLRTHFDEDALRPSSPYP